MTLILTGKDVEKLLNTNLAIDIVEAAFKAHGQGRTRIPDRPVLELDPHEGMIAVMPAYLQELNAAGVKVISHHRRNYKTGLPEGMGIIIYHDPATGMPLAIMDCAFITAVRTGAATAVSAKYMSRKNSRVVGIVGTGALARYQVEGVFAVRSIEKVIAFDIRSTALQQLPEDLKHLGLEIELADGPESVSREADILVTSTSSQEAFVKKQWLRPGIHVAAVGADLPNRRELSPSVYGRVDAFVTDITSQAKIVGEIRDAVAAGELDETALQTTLGEIVLGMKVGRKSDKDITLFKSTGMAIQDVAVAAYVFKMAVEKGIGIEVGITP